MSTVAGWAATVASPGPRAHRVLAIGGIATLTAAYVSVLAEVTAVVGGTETLFATVGAMVVLAAVLARTVRPRTALVAAALVAVVGFEYYFATAGASLGVVFAETETLLADSIALLSGLPVLRMVEAGTWTLGFAPGPVFLSWYFAIRGRYAAGVAAGGAALVVLVLTGDAGTGVAVVGSLGGVAAVGFGELERRDGSLAQADVLAIVLAVVLVLSLPVSFVPGGSDDGAAFNATVEEGTLEDAIDTAPERSGITGEVSLSPELRYTVEAEEAAYWRTGVYDRFAGDEWVRSGEDVPYEGEELEWPAGADRTVTQRVTVESESAVMPAAAQPIALADQDVAGSTAVSLHGQFHPTETLPEGETYAVESAVVERGDHLDAAGTDYPPAVTERYLQTPEDTSEAFEERTELVVDDAETPYETALAIERHLRSSKAYSLDVEKPEGNVAEAFLLEMDAGYCVYFATTMVQMLRVEDVPARYVTGYTSGEQVDDGEWAVRGLDAHAWVEVYFPGHGWVAFEPTPPSAREDVHEEARDAAVGAASPEDVDALADPDDRESDEDSDGNDVDDPDDPDDEEADPDADDPDDPDDEEADPDADDPDDPEDPDDEGDAEETDPGAIGLDDEGGSIDLPSATDLAVAFALAVGLVLGARRTGLDARLGRRAAVYWHGFRGDPDRDVERAYRRLETLLARRYRPRRSTESPRAYLAALSATHDLDPAVGDLTRRYERARYGHGVTRAEADGAIAAIDRLTRRSIPLVGRLVGRRPTRRGSNSR